MDEYNNEIMEDLYVRYDKLFERNCQLASFMPEGWQPLIKRFCEYIVEKQRPLLIRNDDSRLWSRVEEDLFKFQFEQLKEKFGTLRIYFRTSDNTLNQKTLEVFDKDVIEDYIEEARAEITGFHDALCYIANQTCELTGDKGNLHTQGFWLKTLSPAKAKDLGYELAGS